MVLVHAFLCNDDVSSVSNPVVGMMQELGGDEAYSDTRFAGSGWCWFSGQTSLSAVVVQVIGSFVNIMWKFV